MKRGMFEFLCNADKDRSPEIVGWSENSLGPYCWTLCFFIKDREGYNLESIGDRIISHNGDQEDFMALVKYAFVVLNAKFELEERP
jgi:hypothetical protein